MHLHLLHIHPPPAKEQDGDIAYNDYNGECVDWERARHRSGTVSPPNESPAPTSELTTNKMHRGSNVPGILFSLLHPCFLLHQPRTILMIACCLCTSGEEINGRPRILQKSARLQRKSIVPCGSTECTRPCTRF